MEDSVSFTRMDQGTYEEYQFHTVFHAIHNFCAVDLSALYLDVIKDRLYTSAARDPRRRAAQTTCYDVFLALTRLLARLQSIENETSLDWLGVEAAAKAA